MHHVKYHTMHHFMHHVLHYFIHPDLHHVIQTSVYLALQIFFIYIQLPQGKSWSQMYLKQWPICLNGCSLIDGDF